jgi:type IV pilus assembly protein PilB
VASAHGDGIGEFFASIELFSGWDGALLAKVVPHARVAEYAAGTLIVVAGGPPQGMGIVARGRILRAWAGDVGTREALEVGDWFGEESMLLQSAQSFSVVAEQASTVVHLSTTIVDALVDKVPAFARALATRLSRRLTQASDGGGGGARASVPSAAGGQRMSSPPSLGPRASRSSFPAPPGGAAPAIPFVRVADFDPDPQVVAMVPSRLIQQSQLLPLRLQGSVLTVGMVKPHDALALNELRRILTSADIEVTAIGLDDFSMALDRFRVAAHVETRRPSGGAADIVFDQQDAEREPERAGRIIGDEVVQLVNRILLQAIDREASDIHIEPGAGGVRVRYRVSGLLSDWAEPIAASLAKGIAARVKVLAGLDITERRLPQDGRIGARIGRRDIDLRVSTLPSSRGETIVLRLLDAASVLRPLEQVFVEPGTLAAVRRNLDRPYGAVVVAGPTGSGKTSTLYAMLQERRSKRPDSNVLMVEDPVEYRLHGVTQVQVNQVVGLTFARVLRAMLRQDPDVIMVGEVRDHETAELAVEAAMTGHLLLSSVHANDSTLVVQRLENLGCNRTHVAQALSLVLVQRLARKLCARCAQPEPVAPVLLESLVTHRLVDAGKGPVLLCRPVGCESCGHSGFAGRVAVVESLQVTDEIRASLMAGRPLADVRREAEEARRLVTFQRYASFLLAQGSIGASDALLTVAT